MATTNTCMCVYQFDVKSKRIFNLLVKPLIETHTGLTYVDGMSHYDPSNIKMDLICKLIYEANLVVVDVSYKNPNVFLELGIAYAAKKPIVFICSKKQFTSNNKMAWKKKMPFDIEGKELLIFDNDKDLQVQLGRFISDSLFKTKYITIPWFSTEAKNCIRSANELEFFSAGSFWSTVGINHTFIMSYHVKVRDFDNSRHPDVRLFFSNSENGYPRIVIIFPWEHSEKDISKYECHIDYFPSEEGKANHARLQTESVSPIQSGPFEFDLSVSFYHPHLVIESSLFEVSRLIFPIDKLRDLGYGTHKSNYIGFGSGHKITISNILIKEVFM